MRGIFKTVAVSALLVLQAFGKHDCVHDHVKETLSYIKAGSSTTSPEGRTLLQDWQNIRIHVDYSSTF